MVTQGPRRVVVTGIGMVTSVGIGRETTWQALLAAKNGIRSITLCDPTDLESTIAGEVPDFDPLNYVDRKEARRMDRFVHLAIAASGEAIAHSGLDIKENAEEIGVMIGSGIGGIATLEDQFHVLFEKGPGRVSPFLVPMFIPDMASGQVSIVFGARGPNYNTVSACASGADALGAALETIKRGDAVAMLAGGAEATVTRMGIASFAASRALSTKRNHDPEHASRPFDLERDGFVLGEGAATLVLEELEYARARGANILAEFVSYGQSADAFHVTQPSENGEGAARAMRMALRKAGASASDIDYINPHGTSTPMNDRFETMSIKAVFGEAAGAIPISSTKSMVGHTLGACGGIEAAVTVLSIRDQRIHQTRNLEIPDPDCDLDYVPEGPRNLEIDWAMSNSLGFGGHNSSLVFRRYHG
ncbi:MAG: beta-ketoacyl-ACP synthase II [Dehalococcoidia bacterium]|nr:beta-ketoacyl-ACP synthase II [Dehalococcoidia bacterium]HRC62386.1 beta-ketoacyl-ACP synthase II [Dehalococcoidia bacterium]